jgi:hypothetical protein
VSVHVHAFREIGRLLIIERLTKGTKRKQGALGEVVNLLNDRYLSGMSRCHMPMRV